MHDNSADRLPFRALSRVRQLSSSHCGPASLQILLSHFGITAHQEEIVEAGGVRETIVKRGMSVAQLARAVRNIDPRMSLWVKRESTLSDLVKMVREYNYPVAINWQGVFEQGGEYESVDEDDNGEDDGTLGDQGHYSVIIDVDTANNYIRIVDPYGHYAGKDRFFMIQEFLGRWWDDRMDYEADVRNIFMRTD
jgi:hypothetical protein